MNFLRWLMRGWPKPVRSAVIDSDGRSVMGVLRDSGYEPDPRFLILKSPKAVKLCGYQ